MRVNIIGNFAPNTGLHQDACILRGMLNTVFGDSVHMFKVHHIYPQCNDAEVNIFLEVVNPSLFSYARKNIWIPNVEWIFKSWVPYLDMVDEIWAKTHETYEILRNITNTPVKYIGWTSIDKTYSKKKDYSKAIVLVGKNVYRNPKQLLRAYIEIHEKSPWLFEKLPILHIPYTPTEVYIPEIPEQLKPKIVLYPGVLNEHDYDTLLSECGLAICLSAAEGFGHAINEALSSGCNVLLSCISPFRDTLIHDSQQQMVLWATEKEIVQHPNCLGVLVDSDVKSIVVRLKEYVGRDGHSKRSASNVLRINYEHNHSKFIKRMKEILTELVVPEYSLVESLPTESELPEVSIVTLTHNRRKFMPLAKYSYMIQSYPEEKLEWVIVDDGEDCIEDTLIGVPNVKYVRLDKKHTVGEKRNIGVQNAMYDTIVMMDDDDVYPNNSVLQRIAMLYKQPVKECVFCTVIPCYDIVKYSSFMNIPPNTLPMSQRVSEATLAFKKSFWESRKFPEIQVAEGDAFIQNREQMCREISPQDVIVSLVHTSNTSSRKLPEVPEPNGCHYGFNETLFALVSQIGEELSTSCQKETSCETSCESSCESACGDGAQQQMPHPLPHQP